MAEKTPLPLPDVHEPLNAAFWLAAREHRLVMQQCSACGTIPWPPKRICPGCLKPMSPDAWQEIAQTGTIWSFSIYHRAFHPGFADRIPYNVAIVKLDAGPMFVTNVTGGGEVTIGLRVKAHFCEESPDVTLVRFAPVD